MPQDVHISFCELGAALGYFPKEKMYEGWCNGLTLKWLEACFVNDEDTFYQRMQRILILNEDTAIVEKIDQVKEKVKRHDLLSDHDLELLDLLAFYENVELYHNPHHYYEIFNTFFHQTDVAQVSLLAASKKIESLGGLTNIYSEPGIYTKAEIAEYLNSLIQTIHHSGYSDQKPIGLVLQGFDHYIGLSYQVKNSSWKFMDINQWPPIAFEAASTLELAEKIVDGFNEHRGIIPRLPYTALNTLVITTSNNEQRFQLASQLNLWKKNHLISQALSERDGPVNLAFMAALIGDANIIAELAKYDVDFNRTKHSFGATPALIASEMGHVTVITELAKHNVDFNLSEKGGRTPLLRATYLRNTHVIAELAKHGANLETTDNQGIGPLMYAAYFGYVDVFEELVSLGANLAVQLIRGQTPAHLAAQNGHANIITALAKHHFNFNVSANDGTTPASIASENGHAHIIAELAKHGTNFDKARNNGITPAYCAAQKGHVNVIEELARQGAKLDIPANNGFTPTHIAIQEGHVNVIKELAKHNIDLRRPFPDGESALTVAAIKGHTDIVNYLLMNKAIPMSGEFSNTMGKLTQNQQTKLFDGYKFRLNFEPHTTKQLCTILDCLSPTQRLETIDLCKSRLDHMIKTSEDLSIVLKHLQSDQFATDVFFKLSSKAVFSNAFDNTPKKLEELMSNSNLSQHTKMACLIKLETDGLLQPMIREIWKKNREHTVNDSFCGSKTSGELMYRNTQEVSLELNHEDRVKERLKSIKKYVLEPTQQKEPFAMALSTVFSAVFSTLLESEITANAESQHKPRFG